MITAPGSSRMWRGRYKTSKGSWKWVETENRFVDGSDPRVLTSMREVSSQEASLEEQFQAREQLLAQLSDALPVGVFQVDLAGRVTLTNESLHLILGIQPKSSLHAQMATVAEQDKPTLNAALADAFTGKALDGVEIRLRLPPEPPTETGNDRVCLLSLRPLTDSDGVVSGAVGCLSDVTDRARLHEELQIRAAVDELTSCFNRSATIELVEQTLAGRNDTLGCALIFVDLDRLKAVNDRHGHAAGDQVIAAAADRIKDVLRRGDSVGRLGGDEFLVICPSVINAARALEIARRISVALTALVMTDSGWVELRASVGVVWTMESLNADTLIARARQRDVPIKARRRTRRHDVYRG